MRLAIVLFATVTVIATFTQAQNDTLHQDRSQTLRTKLGVHDYGLTDADATRRETPSSRCTPRTSHPQTAPC